MKKCSAVYARQNQHFVVSQSKTTDGLWIVSAPITAISRSAGDAELGSLVKEALDRSSEGVPHPSNWKNVLAPLLEIAKVKSWGAFIKSLALVEISQDDAMMIQLVPMRNLGARDGFVEDMDRAVSIVGMDPERLGIAIRTLFEST